MKRRLLSGETETAVGYQPVGMKPRTRLEPARETSTTATALLSAFATKSDLPSGESARAFGVVPAGEEGVSVTRTFSLTWPPAISSASTVSSLPQDTKRRPSGENARSFGWGPVESVLMVSRFAGSSPATLLRAH